MLLYIGLILTISLLLIAMFFPSYKNPLLMLILIRPIVGATWNLRYLDVSLIYIINVGFIIVFFLRILLKKERIMRFPFSKLIFIYINILIFVSMNVFLRSGIITALDFFSKSLFMPLSFYLFYVYFKEDKDGKALTIALILAGIFPLFFTLYQKISGHMWIYHVSRGLVRNVGLYHDIVAPRIFFIQSLIGIYIYWNYFLKKNITRIKLLLIVLISLFLIGLYFLYSKTGTVILISWTLLFAFVKGKRYILPLALFIVLFLNYFTDNRILNETQQVFSSEVEYARGDLESKYVFSGRVGIWNYYLELWKKSPLLDKLIGDGRSHGWFHNEYLRLLITGGILLLGFFLILAIILFINVGNNYLKDRKAIHFVAILCIVYFFIESMGQLPGLYPDMEMLVWGILGLSFNSKLNWSSMRKVSLLVK